MICISICVIYCEPVTPEHQKRLTAINLMEISSLVVLTEPPSLPAVGWLPLELRLDGSSIILLRFIAGCICYVQVEDRISRSLFQGLGVLLR